jgi:hypothetical protein
MPPAGLTFLAATTWPASQGLVPTVFRLPLVPSGVREFIRFNGPLQVAIGCVGQGGVTQPPAPTLAGPEMDTQFPRNATRRTREAQQKGRQHPVWERPLALGEQRVGEIVEGAPTAVAPGAFQPGPVVVMAPGTDGVALTTGTVERTIFPP